MSTLVPALTDYTALITSEHRDKPNFLALVSLFGQFAVDERSTLLGLGAKFDLDTAVGAQLDVLGAWLGQQRAIVPLNSEAYPAPPNPVPVVLTDTNYRRLLKAIALARRWDGTPAMAKEILAIFYNDSHQQVVVIDNQNMSIDLLMAGFPVGIVGAAVFKLDLLGLKPSGVRIRRALTSFEQGPIFGLDSGGNPSFLPPGVYYTINGPDYGVIPKEF